ncbi:hypothetical protein [Metabacillus sp. 84]|uniref:hypothetical protein n=1 Tax=Metabacillus sp. 84 TaxID=3404705 RepID=UPI003CEDEBB1
MNTFFIITSVLLHIVSLYLILLLFTKLAFHTDTKKEQQSILEDTEQLLAAFMLEQREEHDRLMRALEHAAGPEQETESESANRIENRKIGNTHIEEEPEMAEQLPDHLLHAEEMEDSVEWSHSDPVPEEAVRLYEEGRSIEEIARKTGKGKTEIELLLKFRRK